MKKKILLFDANITTYGITKIISDYINNFSSDIVVEIMTFKVMDDFYIKDKNIKIYEIGNIKNIINRIKKEYEIIKNGKYDVVHINGDYISRLLECISSRLAKVKKIIIHSHNTGSGNNKKFKILLHNTFKKFFDFFATDYFACSNNAAKWMFSKKIVKSKKYKVIKNGININKFKFNEDDRNEIRKKYEIEDKYVIGFVGRLSYQKNPLFLIDIFNECLKKKKNSVLIIIGTGSLEKDIKEKVKKLKIDKQVLLLGKVSDVCKYYNAMDCFILPSVYEGLGIVNIEAQASGLKTIVSTEVPIDAKVSDLIEYISLEDSINEWSEKVIEDIKIDRKNAYKQVIEYGYDLKSVVNELEKIYNN